MRHGYTPQTPLGPPPQGEPAFGSYRDPHEHHWLSAGFDPNGAGLHLFCAGCGRVIIPMPERIQHLTPAPSIVEHPSEEYPRDE